MIFHTNEELCRKTEIFWEDNPPAELCRNLRCLLIDYLAHELAEGHPAHVNEFLPDLIALFNWLDKAAIAQATGNNDDHEQFLWTTAHFLNDHAPSNLYCRLLRLWADYLAHILEEGYPKYLNSFLPSFMALLDWLDEAAKALKEN